jgi:hypothetical protein
LQAVNDLPNFKSRYAAQQLLGKFNFKRARLAVSLARCKDKT